MKFSLSFPALCLLLFLALANESFACSCDSPMSGTGQEIINQAREKSKAVFAGEVTKIVLSEAPEGEEPTLASVHFKVAKVWKGVTTETVVVSTINVCCICGYEFKVGKQYLVYAGGNESLSTNICTRTRQLKYAAGDLQVLGEPEKIFAEQKQKKRTSRK